MESDLLVGWPVDRSAIDKEFNIAKLDPAAVMLYQDGWEMSLEELWFRYTAMLDVR